MDWTQDPKRNYIWISSSEYRIRKDHAQFNLYSPWGDFIIQRDSLEDAQKMAEVVDALVHEEK